MPRACLPRRCRARVLRHFSPARRRQRALQCCCCGGGVERGAGQRRRRVRVQRACLCKQRASLSRGSHPLLARELQLVKEAGSANQSFKPLQHLKCCLCGLWPCHGHVRERMRVRRHGAGLLLMACKHARGRGWGGGQRVEGTARQGPGRLEAVMRSTHGPHRAPAPHNRAAQRACPAHGPPRPAGHAPTLQALYVRLLYSCSKFSGRTHRKRCCARERWNALFSERVMQARSQPLATDCACAEPSDKRAACFACSAARAGASTREGARGKGPNSPNRASRVSKPFILLVKAYNSPYTLLVLLLAMLLLVPLLLAALAQQACAGSIDFRPTYTVRDHLPCCVHNAEQLTSRPQPCMAARGGSGDTCRSGIPLHVGSPVSTHQAIPYTPPHARRS